MMNSTKEKTGCVVVGGGPAGMVLGLLLARGGVEVTVLEKHGDFLRDFRGDTVHASTLTLLDELGLGPAFERIPHRLMTQAVIEMDAGDVTVADLRHLPGAHQAIALVPQWDLLDLLADAGKQEPTFRLVMEAQVTDIVRDGDRIVGVVYDHDGARHELRADAVIACDGRGSDVRRAAGLHPRDFGVPMDVLWFRLPRGDGDPTGLIARFSVANGMIIIDRGDYYQCAYVIRKGSDAEIRAEGVAAFRARIALLVPWLADRVDSLVTLDDVKLLSVQLDRLRRWYADGLLCIGDAAHAMSPIGGVGINLAVQDAVAAARLLRDPLLRGPVTQADLRRVQRRRWLPTAIVQGVQRMAHRFVLGKRINPQPRAADPNATLPLPLRVVRRLPVLQRIPGYLVAIGPRPEHAPEWARSTPERVAS